MHTLLDRYLELLQRIDRWFARCTEQFPERIRCTAGCSECCRGLFDITLLDALLLRRGFDRLSPQDRIAPRQAAQRRLAQLQKQWPDYAAPYLLNHMPDEQWVEMPEDDLTPCPLLGQGGRCLVYAHRPMICRLHGLPHIDRSGESFSDAWCTLNFPGEDPAPIEALRWSFREAFEEEIALFDAFSLALTGKTIREMDTFIPMALLIDLDGINWHKIAL